MTDPKDVFPDELSTIAAVRFDPRTEDAPAYALTVVEGPAQGRRFVIDASQPGRVLLGESVVCQIRLDDRQISRRHAAFDHAGDGLRITDLGSTNGTRINGVRVTDGLLEGGEVIRIGASALRVDREPATRRQFDVSPSMRFGRFLGGSLEMRRLYPLCERLAASNVPVIIEGETGTGKEVLAEAIHEMGPRAAQPFIVFDCTAVPANLIESELFGHDKGAFTGAHAARRGVFELAAGGTLLIDEIGDLDLPMQAKLLRAVERGEVRRVGAERFTRVDVRILAATRRDLDQMVTQGTFRDDLFHRLAVGRIELPPLRKRRGDVSLLARAFWQGLGGDPARLPTDVLLRWESEPWPGNVRELRNAVSRQAALGELAHTSPQAPAPATSEGLFDELIRQGVPFSRARQRVLDAFQRRYIEHVLAQHGGDTAKAAAASGLARRYFNFLRARSR